MAKQAYYFPHDSNARNDDKIISIRMKYGMEGYGVYFAILERMLESGKYYIEINSYAAIAFDFHVDSELVKSIVEDFGLFKITEEGTHFYSESFNDRMQPLNNLREQRKKAGKASAEKRAKSNDRSTTVQRQLDENSTDKRKEENKREENIKEYNNTPTPPKVGVPPGDGESLKEEPEKKGKPKGKRGKIKPELPNKEARELFENHFLSVFGEKYYWTSKDAGGMSQLLKKLKYQVSQKKDIQDVPDDLLIDALHAFLSSIHEGWVFENFSVTIINSKFNELIAKARTTGRSNLHGVNTSRQTSHDKRESRRNLIELSRAILDQH